MKITITADMMKRIINLSEMPVNKPVLAKFTNRNDTIEYTTEILDLLCTDKYIEYILDAENGFIIFDKGEKYVDDNYKYLARYF